MEGTTRTEPPNVSEFMNTSSGVRMSENMSTKTGNIDTSKEHVDGVSMTLSEEEEERAREVCRSLKAREWTALQALEIDRAKEILFPKLLAALDEARAISLRTGNDLADTKTDMQDEVNKAYSKCRNLITELNEAKATIRQRETELGALRAICRELLTVVDCADDLWPYSRSELEALKEAVK